MLPATIYNRLNGPTNRHSQNKGRISGEEVLSFEVTYIAIEQDHHLILDQLAPFNLPNLALYNCRRNDRQRGNHSTRGDRLDV